MGILAKYESALSSGATTLINTGNPFLAVKSLAEGWVSEKETWKDFVDEFGIEDEGMNKILSFGASIVFDPIMWIPFTPVARFGVKTSAELVKGGYNVMKKTFPMEKIMTTEGGKITERLVHSVLGVVDRVGPSRYLEEGLKTHMYDDIRKGIILEGKATMDFREEFSKFLSPRIKKIRQESYPIIGDRANYLVNKGKLNVEERELAEYIYKQYDTDVGRMRLPGTPEEILKAVEQHPVFEAALKRMKKGKMGIPIYVKDYMPRYYKDLKETFFSGKMDPKDFLRSPGALVSLPSQFVPSFMKLRIVKDAKGKDLIEDPILGFLKYKSDLFRKLHREPTYFLVRAQIQGLRRQANVLEKSGKAYEAQRIRSKTELFARLLMDIQGKTPRDSLIEGFSRTATKTIYAATLLAPGSVLKNLGQIMLSWGIIGRHIFTGVKKLYSKEGKELLKEVPHIFAEWRPEFLPIYELAAKEKVGLNKMVDVIKNAIKYPDELGSFEKQLVEKIYGKHPKKIGNIINWLQEKALKPFSWAEGFLRGSTYLGARERFLDFHKLGKIDELLKDVRRPFRREITSSLAKGNITEAASKYADDIVGITQFRYGTLDTPSLLKDPVGRMALQFTSFPINLVSMLHYFLEHNMHENFTKLLGLGVYNLYAGQKIGANLKEFSIFGAVPAGAAPIPAMLFSLHNAYLYPDITGNLYTFNRLLYLTVPGGRFMRKGNYVKKTLQNYAKTGELEIQDDYYRLSRKTSFPELVAYLFDLPTINQGKIRSDFKALKRAKSEYARIRGILLKAHAKGDYKKMEEIREKTGISLTDEQVERYEWARRTESFERALTNFPKTARNILIDELGWDQKELEEMLDSIPMRR